MTTKTYRKGLPWTPAQDAYLLDNSATMTDPEIAAHLGRNVNAVKQRRYTLAERGQGVRTIERASSEWADDGAIAYLPTPEQIAAECAKIRAKRLAEMLESDQLDAAIDAARKDA